jgi:hydrogenase nickel incorporation protein HypB
MVAHVAEGHDKPIKYPGMFAAVDVIVLNKIDLMPYVDFDHQLFDEAIRALNHEARVIDVSCKTGEGIDDWLMWLEAWLA